MNKGHIPIRMCIICRKRLEKQILKKIKFDNPNFNIGKGFYICEKCLNLENEILNKKISKIIKNKFCVDKNLKENIFNGKF